ncbi:MAG: phosphoribosylanthranilate isomerase [Thomasclavelia sp.]|uniref:phosphoribosylanthranilate isomerase n=1 Tax=Thomasclavelia sp. TaxID=3025757 RepID=UPI0039A0C991
MKIKICGLFQSKDIDYVNEAKPDYIGFVFAKSKRQVDLYQAHLLKARLDSQIKTVGVFVDSSIEKIVELVNKEIIDIIQLHGNENNVYIKQLKEYTDIPIIKAIKVKQASDLDNLDYDVDYYLLDNKISGSGESFDWSVIKDLDKPFFLAGGIDLNNIEEAIQIKCFGLDVSSGAETNGIKDRNKIIEIVRRVKNDDR